MNRNQNSRRNHPDDNKYDSILGDGYVPPPQRHSKPRKAPEPEPTDDWYWGRYKNGGGGAPLRDTEGNQVTNLRQVHRGTVEIDRSPYNERKNRHRKSENNNDDYDDDGGGPSYIPGLTGNSSPKKFMSSLREITCGISPEEQEIKARKELEYQTQLKLQIDEKKRLKIQEKRKQEELKRKELEEYYRSYYKGNIPRDKLQELRKPIIIEGEDELFNSYSGQAKNNLNRRKEERSNLDYEGDTRRSKFQDRYDDDEDVNYKEPSYNRFGNSKKPLKHNDHYHNEDDEYNDEDEDYGKGSKKKFSLNMKNIKNTSGGGGGGNYEDEDEDEYNNARKSTVKRGGGGAGVHNRGRNHDEPPVEIDRKNTKPNKKYLDKSYDDDDYDHDYDAEDAYSGRSPTHRKNKNNNTKLKWVPKEEYDELSNLCEKLLHEHELLEEELQDKAKMIERMKKTDKTSQSTRSASSIQKAGKSSLISDKSKAGATNQQHRSQSVHNINKPEKTGNNKPKSATAFGRKALPVTTKSEPKQQSPPANKSFVELAAEGLNRLPEKPKKSIRGPVGSDRQSGLKKLNLNLGKEKEVPREYDRRGGDESISNLALKIKGSNQAGPRIVINEEDAEDDRASRKPPTKAKVTWSGGNSSDSASELKGISEHLYNKNGKNSEELSEDQLDRLLLKAKKSRAGASANY